MTQAQTIREAIPELTDQVLKELEEIMRHVIFHSTLDWQSKEELQCGAREAFAVYLIGINNDVKAAAKGARLDPGHTL